MTRGFNQATLLLRYAARGLSINIDSASLRRIRPTPPQAQLSRTKRQHNLRGAFCVPASRDKFIAGKKILLVDDVVTTGATMASAAQTLRLAGASHVFGCCLARAES